MSMLPLEKSKPENELAKFIIMIYGRPKIGKTSLAAQFEDPLFFMFESGAKALSLYKIEITSWAQFKEASAEVRSPAGKRFKTIVFDTFAIAYELCSKHVCKELKIDHPSDMGYGKAWQAVEAEFNTEMNKLSLSGKGIVLLAHADDKDVEQADGTIREMTAPEVSKAAMRFVNRSVDLCAYYYYAPGNERKIRVQATESVVAGNRIEGHFKGITKFSAGSSAEQAYKKFLLAFENKIETKEIANGKSDKHQGLLLKRSRGQEVQGSAGKS